ncbi:MAG: hypothetical protein H7329_02240 [Opitutaceae bacterium]|nr:hypothetical protein [Cytophagales bacterium]
MKLFLPTLFILTSGIASFSQPIVSSNNMVSDTMSFKSDPIMTNYTDSSQFSAYAYNPEELQPIKGHKKRFKRTSASSSSKSSRRTSASNRRR